MARRSKPKPSFQFAKCKQMTGTVISGTQNSFMVEGAEGLLYLATLKGKRLSLDADYYNPLAPGDKVDFIVDDFDSEKAQIVALQPRKNFVARYNEKKKAIQLLAANVDNTFLVTTPLLPDFKPHFIERSLVQMDKLGVKPIILCNKFDFIDDSPLAQKWLALWRDLGYTVMFVSAKTGEGMAELAGVLTDRLSVFVGQSGVGKSSLVNVLDDTCVLKVGSLSKKYGRGKHTTTKGQMVHITLNTSLTGGVAGVKASVIDTPGVKKFVLHGIKKEELATHFFELAPLASRCQFGTSCTHTSEAGCAILEAVKNGKVSPLRFDSYQRMRAEV